MLFFCDLFSLWQGSISSSSSAKLVDCILALKSYHEWKQGGALGFWRLKSPNHATGNSTNSKFTRSRSMNSSSNSRKKWAILDHESLDDSSLASLSNDPEPTSSVSSHDARPNGPSGENRSPVADREEVTSNVHNPTGTGLLVLFFWLSITLGDPLNKNYLLYFSCFTLLAFLVLTVWLAICSAQTCLATTSWRQISRSSSSECQECARDPRFHTVHHRWLWRIDSSIRCMYLTMFNQWSCAFYLILKSKVQFSNQFYQDLNSYCLGSIVTLCIRPKPVCTCVGFLIFRFHGGFRV
jgi:hypothetical protein